MPTYVLIDADNKAVNLMEWDGNEKTWQPPAGHRCVPYDGPYRPGCDWDDTSKKVLVPEEPQPVIEGQALNVIA